MPERWICCKVCGVKLPWKEAQQFQDIYKTAHLPTCDFHVARLEGYGVSWIAEHGGPIEPCEPPANEISQDPM